MVGLTQAPGGIMGANEGAGTPGEAPAFSPAQVDGCIVWVDPHAASVVEGDTFLSIENLAPFTDVTLEPFGTNGVNAFPDVGDYDTGSGDRTVLDHGNAVNSTGITLSREVNVLTLYMVMRYKDGVDALFDTNNTISYPQNNHVDRIWGNVGTANWRVDGTTPDGADETSVNGAAASSTILPLPLAIVKFAGTGDPWAIKSLGADFQNPGGDLSWQGIIGEIAAYSGTVSSEDDTALLSYFATKWGITLP